MKKLIAAICLLTTGLTMARSFEKISIPDAKCGNGMDYQVFMSSEGKDARKLAVEFMGGGVCWNSATCFGPNWRTWIHPLPKLISQFNVLAWNRPKNSPLSRHMLLYFPYCTGDVFAGQHSTKYEWGPEVHHQGYSNILKAMNHLQKVGYLNFKSIDDIVLYGSSAGGIASLLHAPNFDQVISKKAKRTIIADSPGLHFGKDFWNKFTDQQKRDFNLAFNKVGLYQVMNDGMVADRAPSFCRALGNWEIGIMQGAQDVVMSTVFGDISTEDHRDLVYSSRGIFRQTQTLPNCSAWTPDTKMHTFLLTSATANMETDDGTSALVFARRVYSRRNQERNYR